jgi:hypothetical protein
MRKRYRVSMFAALVAALVVPVGFALSLESTTVATQARYTAAVPSTAMAIVPRVAAARVASPSNIHLSGASSPAQHDALPDAAKLLCVGTVLFGLAAVARKRI